MALTFISIWSSGRSLFKLAVRPTIRGYRSTTLHCVSTAVGTTDFATVVLEKGKARLFQDGNPLIYGGAVKELKGNPAAGDEVIVTDHMGNVLGRGLFNPHSTYRVRMLSRGFEKVHSLPLGKLLEARVSQALALRSSLGLPSKENTVYRLINGEGDRLGGLIVDVFDMTIVAQSSALWCEKHRDVIEASLVAAMNAAQQTESKRKRTFRLIWRRAESRLKQDGYTGRTGDDPLPAGSTAAPIVVKENKLKYSTSPEDGQKTGFYCDQRANRMLIRGVAEGKSVLDTYCYSGGFAINAAIGGASRVVAVDSSQPALDAAAENAVLNGLTVHALKDVREVGKSQAEGTKSPQIELLKGDCVEVMRALAESQPASFDVVICDPPKLAPSRKDLDKARNKYLKINQLALSLVKPGGLLMTCTCSAAMTQAYDERSGSAFLDTINEAARISRREVTLLSTSGAAADHPVNLSYQEGRYLTAVLLHVH